MKYYVITTGIFYGDNGAVLFDGCYSGGNKGKVPAAINNPAYCSVKDTGPLPPGLYTIGEPHYDSTTGDQTMNLTPDAGNEMHGRSEFRLHGDNYHANHSASDGCVIKSPSSVRCLAWNSGSRLLTVVATPNELPWNTPQLTQTNATGAKETALSVKNLMT